MKEYTKCEPSGSLWLLNTFSNLFVDAVQHKNQHMLCIVGGTHVHHIIKQSELTISCCHC